MYPRKNATLKHVDSWPTALICPSSQLCPCWVSLSLKNEQDNSVLWEQPTVLFKGPLPVALMLPLLEGRQSHSQCPCIPSFPLPPPHRHPPPISQTLAMKHGSYCPSLEITGLVISLFAAQVLTLQSTSYNSVIGPHVLCLSMLS